MAKEINLDGLTRHPATDQLLRWFSYQHLPIGRTREVSSEFHDLAYKLADHYELTGPELTAGLRKLMEAKDCAVRAALG